ncbi:hypothetical protein [Streptomyces sp. N35]|uniref:hypothetical protein n=1 Tax=Streptomyces sp. N35 TaxID=2795730 RepID=UPI0018F3FE68|nr:hypothetical protein [Streptomyces sp. N35]
MTDESGVFGGTGRRVVLALMSCAWLVLTISTVVELPHVSWPGWALVVLGGAFVTREWRYVRRQEAR